MKRPIYPSKINTINKFRQMRNTNSKVFKKKKKMNQSNVTRKKPRQVSKKPKVKKQNKNKKNKKNKKKDSPRQKAQISPREETETGIKIKNPIKTSIDSGLVSVEPDLLVSRHPREFQKMLENRKILNYLLNEADKSPGEDLFHFMFLSNRFYQKNLNN